MEKRINSGVLFAMGAKINPKSPDYQGDLYIDLNGMDVKDGKVEIRIAGWKKQTKTGSTMLSLAVDRYKKKTANKNQGANQVEDDPF